MTNFMCIWQHRASSPPSPLCWGLEPMDLQIQHQLWQLKVILLGYYRFHYLSFLYRKSPYFQQLLCKPHIDTTYLLGRSLIICFNSSSNPTSKIRSASSITRHCRFLYINPGVFYEAKYKRKNKNPVNYQVMFHTVDDTGILQQKVLLPAYGPGDDRV